LFSLVSPYLLIGKCQSDASFGSRPSVVGSVIAGNELLRALFRIVLLPIVGIVHIAALVFTSVADAVGSKDAASVAAFGCCVLEFDDLSCFPYAGRN
jgi:hypothetical protein